MESKTERNYAGEFILSEAEGRRSRDTVTVVVAAGDRLETGRLLGKLAETGSYVRIDAAATDGSEAVAGILYDEIDNSAEDPETGDALEVDAVIVNADAEVAAERLFWGDHPVGGLTGGFMTDEPAVAGLLALGIKARGTE